MPAKKITSSRELAKLAGVSHMTVARAFRNDRHILPETRDRILHLAEKHGYRPNPIHSLHALAKGQDSKRKSQGTIAFVQQYARLNSWAELPNLYPYLQGIQQQTEKLGFGLDEFSMHENAYTPEQLDRTLAARGIQGVIFGTAPSSIRTVDFNWDNYSCVAIQQLSWEPLLHRVLKDWIHETSTILSEVTKLGYKRIGLALAQSHDTDHRHAVRGIMLAHQETLPAKQRVPVLIYKGPVVTRNKSEIQTWVKQHKPDCIITGDSQMLPLIESLGLEVPGDIGLVHTTLGPDVAHWTGYKTDYKQFGIAAVDMVVNRIVRNELGLPQAGRDVYLRGEWQSGETTR